MTDTFDQISAASSSLRWAKASHYKGLRAQSAGRAAKAHFADRDVHMKNARTYLGMRKDGYRGSLPPLSQADQQVALAAVKRPRH
jgi:hypothetical protein